jgi:hypothetical protein
MLEHLTLSFRCYWRFVRRTTHMATVSLATAEGVSSKVLRCRLLALRRAPHAPDCASRQTRTASLAPARTLSILRSTRQTRAFDL